MQNKRHRRGDVRGDGMIFWEYNKLAKGGQSWCNPEKFEEKRKSRADYRRKYREANKDAIADKGRERQQKNKELLKEYHKKYYQANKEKFSARSKYYYQANRDKILDKVKENYQNNKEAITAHKKERYNSEPLYRLAVLSRCRIVIAFKKQGYTKKSKTQKMLGCSFSDLLKHVELQFTEGMTWDNQGEWHIDHRLPLSAATSEDELIKLNHCSNLQPLWELDNLRKGDSYDPEELKAYLAA